AQPGARRPLLPRGGRNPGEPDLASARAAARVRFHQRAGQRPPQPPRQGVVRQGQRILRHLKKSQIEEFYDAGYVVLPGVFRDAEIREISKAFDRLRDTAVKLTKPRMIKGSYFVVNEHKINRIVWCGAAEPVLLKYGEDPRLTLPSSQLLGSREMDQLICQAHFKLPADGVGFGWHQDSDHRRYGTDMWTDVNGRGSFVQTLMAVDVMNEENGPLMVVPGSGRQGHRYLKQNPSPLDVLF